MTNSIFMEGRITAKANVTTTTSGKKYARFSICYNENRKNPNGEWTSTPNFFNCSAWGKTAEYIEALDKGEPIFITGKLKNETYINSRNEKKNITYILAFRVQKLAIERKNTAPQNAPQETAQTYAQEPIPQNEDFSDFTPAFEDIEPPEFDIMQ